MKKLVVIISILLSASLFAGAQKIINESVDVDGQKVKMEFDFADNITIEAWKKNAVELEVSVNIDDNNYNDYYNLEIKKSSGFIKFEEEVDFEGIKKAMGVKNLCNFNTDLIYTLKVPEDLEFDLNTISGEIELIGCKGEMDINTVSGFIDYSIPQSHKAMIDLSTVTGDVYSNVKFDNTKLPEAISWVGTNRQLSLNGGNTGVELKTVSGDIYLREK